MHARIQAVITATVMVAAAGCSSTSSSDEAGMGRVNVRLSTMSTSGSNASLLMPGITISQGADVMVIDKVQLVARKIKLERTNGTCPTPVVESSGSGKESDEDSSDECPNLRLGPVLLDLPIGDGVAPLIAVDILAGTYDELKLQIHKPTSRPADAAFVAANPNFAGVSIRVEGTFNGAPYTFTTDLTAVVELEFETPVVVAEGGSTSLTLQLDVRSWFLGQGGGSLVNPLTLSQQGRSRVDQNIRASFRAFRDDNQDGRDD
ncbi:MAG: hypothetical protein ABIS03_03505 [Gemmatimonadaceae bacterium]